MAPAVARIPTPPAIIALGACQLGFWAARNKPKTKAKLSNPSQIGTPRSHPCKGAIISREMANTIPAPERKPNRMGLDCLI